MAPESPISSTSAGFLPAVSYAVKSDVGKRREENQDSFAVHETEHLRLYVVADGMGGVQGGAIASKIAVDIFTSVLAEKTEIIADDIRQAVEAANAEIFRRGTNDPALTGMGTTLVALVFNGTRLFIANIGDSRAYLVRDSKIIRLTEDHTLVMELLRSGTITADQAVNHPVAHMLTRSLGPADQVEVDCAIINSGPFKRDRFLLCSDGLYNLVKDRELLAILRAETLQGTVDELIETANERGGTDNITCVAIEAGEGFPEYTPDRARETADDGEEEAEPVSRPVRDERPGYTAGEGTRFEEMDEAQPETFIDAEQPATDEDAKKGSGKKRSKISMETLRASFYAESGTGSSSSSQAQAPAVSPAKSGGLFVSYLSIVLGLVITAVAGSFVGIMLSSPSKQERRPVDLSPGAGDEASLHEAAAVLHPGARKVSTQNGPQAAVPTVPAAVPTPEAPHAIDSLAALASRSAAIKDRIQRLDLKIGALEGRSDIDFLPLLTQAVQRHEQIEASLDSLRTEIDLATRKLAVWYGRRKRLESTEPVNLASEVAVSSQHVRDAKSKFEKITWEYLNELENLKYDPTNVAQNRKVDELIRQRTQSLDALSRAVREAIEQSIADSDHQISELTLKRDQQQAELREVQAEQDLARILNTPDPQARESKKAELLQERELLSAELEELTRLIAQSAPPPEQEAQSGEAAALPVADEAAPVSTQPPAA